MTQDEIIEMARQAGMMPHSVYDFAIYVEELEAFAKLITDKHREALELALVELYRHATDTESGEKAIAKVEGVLK